MPDYAMMYSGKTEELIYRKFSSDFLVTARSINDLKEKEFSGEELTAFEKEALCNFDRLRIRELSRIKGESYFHIRYRYIEMLANVKPFVEFLRINYLNN